MKDMNELHSTTNEILFADTKIEKPEDILKTLRPHYIDNYDIKRQFYGLIIRHTNCIALNWADCGKIKGFQMEIKLKPNWKPWNIPCYSNNWRFDDEQERQCKLLETAKFIEEINPCDAPVKTSPTWAAKGNGE